MRLAARLLLVLVAFVTVMVTVGRATVDQHDSAGQGQVKVER
jgi:hypothetical protein